MATVHISETQAAGIFAEVMARARAGVEVVIENDESPSIVLHVAAEKPLRQLSESLRLARKHGSTITLDGGFAADLEAVIDSHTEPLENLWD